MFEHAKSFRGIGLEGWDVSNVVTTNNMFYWANEFDCNLSRWNVSSVTDMTEMFAKTDTFEGVGLNNWNINQTANVTDVFCDATAMNSSYVMHWEFPADSMFCN